MKKRSTLTALLTSALALVICVSMLVGTTFAWFTDSATSANNKIQAGTLDVELYKWTSATEKTNISATSAPAFDAVLWEPGMTQTVYFSVKNAGNLDLKFRVILNVTEISEHDLTEVMEYAITPGATFNQVESWAEGDPIISGETQTDLKDMALYDGEEYFFALSIHMLESAGNEYMADHITFDIEVGAGQLTSEKDSFGSDKYDEMADYPGTGVTKVPANASAVEVQVTDKSGYKTGSAVIPAAAVAEGASEVKLNVKDSIYKANISVTAGSEVKAFDVSVEGIKSAEDYEEGVEPVAIKVSLKIAAGLDPATVKVYHYDTQIDSEYNPNTGYVTFETATFSPFTVVFDPESEYEAPEVTEGMDKPTATVTYAGEYVNNSTIEWGNYGQWSPTAGLDANLEAAFVFACPEELDPEIEAAFEYWYCDFYVSLNKNLGANQLFLGGNYGSFGWVGFHNGDLTLDANTEIGLLESVTTNPWTYADVRDYVGEFTCGVGDVNNALEGATFTVKLRLTNPADTSEFYDVNVVTYTFGGSYTIK